MLKKGIGLPDGVELTVGDRADSADDVVALDGEDDVGHAGGAVGAVELYGGAVYDYMDLHLAALAVEGSGDARH